MRKKHIPASIRETAFNCPHCGALTSQYWYNTFAQQIGDGGIPFIPNTEVLENFQKIKEIELEQKERFIEQIKEMMNGLVLLYKSESQYLDFQLLNLSISRCYNCNKIAVWVYDRLLFPAELHGEEPNIDIPDDILRDYEEARSILNLSFRGAAALLRLVIQKLCKFLGEKGENINDDIASLVKKGLSPIIQKSLDIVRVVGNEAVHPGTIDLRDDIDTASKLFRLVNLIAEQMISHPKHVNDMYDGLLPSSKKQQIDKRDAKKP